MSLSDLSDTSFQRTQVRVFRDPGPLYPARQLSKEQCKFR
jgi:hypothetical protein